MENQVSILYKRSALLNGEPCFSDNKIIISKIRKFYNNLIKFIDYFLIASHLIVFIFDNQILNDNLIYWRLVTSSGIYSRYINLAGGLILVTFLIPIPHYQKFSADQIQLIGFLFCFDVKRMQNKFKLSEKRSKIQIKYQRIFLYAFRFIARSLSFSYMLFFIKISYINITNTYLLPIDLSLTYILIAIKIILNLLLEFSLYSLSFRFLVFVYEVLLTLEYLSCRLDDLSDEILEILPKKNPYEKFIAVDLKKIWNITTDTKIIKLLSKYNLILNDRDKYNKHFNIVNYWCLDLLCFSIGFPFIIIFNQNLDHFLLVFFVINCIAILGFFNIYMFFNNRFLYSNLNFLNNITYLSKYINSRSSIKILNIYQLNTSRSDHSLNFYHFYNFSYRFLIFWTIESISVIFLLYQTVKIN